MTVDSGSRFRYRYHQQSQQLTPLSPWGHGPNSGCREEVARLTGLEPATPGVTGRYSNQLSYNRAWGAD